MINMEELLKSTAFCQPVGVRCMELCVKDINEMTKQTIRKHELFDFSKSPSWKFPHISVDKLDIRSVVEIYNSRNLPESHQYQELLELLVDRMYFAVLTAFQLTSSLQETFGQEQSMHNNVGQGDCTQNTGHMVSWNENLSKRAQDVEIMGKLSYPNLATVLNSLQEKLSGMVDAKSKTKRKPKQGERKLTNSGTQTVESIGNICETCFIAQNLLKFLACTVTDCYEALRLDSQENAQEPSEIGKFREELKTSVWQLSQRAVVTKWSRAVQTDCKAISQKIERLIAEKIELIARIENDKGIAEEEEKKQTLVIEELRQSLKTLEDGLFAEKREKRKFMKQAQVQSKKVVELEKQYQEKVTECVALSDTVEDQKDSLQRLKNIHNELHATHAQMEESSKQLQLRLNEELNSKEGLQRRVNGLEAQIEIKDEELTSLNLQIEMYKSDAIKKDEMKQLLEKARLQLESAKKSEDDNKKERIMDQSEIQKLKKEMEEMSNRIELLTLFPDLNGAINSPTEDTGNPLLTMEKQVESNKLRIQLLQMQTDKLTCTLGKIRNHMQFQSM